MAKTDYIANCKRETDLPVEETAENTALFHEIDHQLRRISMEKLADRFASRDISFSPEIFARLWAIHLGGISDAYNAYKYLQLRARSELGIQPELIHGVVHRVENHAFSEISQPWNFIGFYHEDNYVFYDPAHPNSPADGITPKISIIDQTLFHRWDARAREKRSLLILGDIITGEQALYGVNAANAGFNIEDIVNLAPAPITPQLRPGQK